MNKLLWSCAALFTLFVTVESLTCNTCDTSVFGYCLSTKAINCTGTQDQCYSGVATFSSDEILDIHSRGCITKTSCKNSTNLAIFTVKYNIIMHCCTTNYCNGATSIRMPLTTAVGAALVAIWTRWSL
ncbi:sperm acrosome membrane-associated protein 4-like [Sphaeramia orbicularis]|uniref:sperm acrosome membrane-associated protein 4-like n=1 Tax=Sphaeramia orbicularis TaxID=375764 RepID=UPI00117D8F55|nr:sperm acrosome membrane-associated protein 4-like [Sphaeramia orbicularis]